MKKNITFTPSVKRTRFFISALLLALSVSFFSPSSLQAQNTREQLKQQIKEQLRQEQRRKKQEQARKKQLEEQRKKASATKAKASQDSPQPAEPEGFVYRFGLSAGFGIASHSKFSDGTAARYGYKHLGANFLTHFDRYNTLQSGLNFQGNYLGFLALYKPALPFGNNYFANLSVGTQLDIDLTTRPASSSRILSQAIFNVIVGVGSGFSSLAFNSKPGAYYQKFLLSSADLLFYIPINYFDSKYSKDSQQSFPWQLGVVFNLYFRI